MNTFTDKLLVVVVAILALTAGLLIAGRSRSTLPPAPSVYVQSGDTFYHRAKCECLSGKEQPFTEEAATTKGYKPCVICVVNNTLLDPAFHKAAYQEKLETERQELKAAQEEARIERQEQEEQMRLQAAQLENERIAQQEALSAQQAQLQEEQRLQYNQSISNARKQRESEKYRGLTNRRTITSEDVYQQLKNPSTAKNLP